MLDISINCLKQYTECNPFLGKVLLFCEDFGFRKGVSVGSDHKNVRLVEKVHLNNKID